MQASQLISLCSGSKLWWMRKTWALIVNSEREREAWAHEINAGIEGLREANFSAVVGWNCGYLDKKSCFWFTSAKKGPAGSWESSKICDPASEERKLGIHGGTVRHILAAGFEVRRRVGGKAAMGVLRLSSSTLGNMSDWGAASCFLNYLFF